MAIQRCPRCLAEGRRGVPVRDKATGGYCCSYRPECAWRVVMDPETRTWRELTQEEAAALDLQARAAAPTPAAQATSTTTLPQAGSAINVTEVRLTLRVSREVGAGVWKALECGATAAVVGPMEAAQRELYQVVKAELARVWESSPAPEPVPAPAAMPNGNGHNGNDQDKGFCKVHGVQMKRWEKEGRAWYSHKADEGWCSGR